MQDQFSKDKVRENGPKRFGHRLEEEIQGMEFRDLYELAAKVT